MAGHLARNRADGVMNFPQQEATSCPSLRPVICGRLTRQQTFS